ncbi:MAG: type II toxin-antitoxin system HicA family toxin [Candidatus Aureabacteria bacterium]|nr:type II toxin-antitoxin system HicA family toxin [Candidatus Auribacterota bacterium]
MKKDVLLQRIRAGAKKNIRFADFTKLVEAHGFIFAGQVGSHRGYKHSCGAVLNLQKKDGEAKHYQINQFLKIVDDYGLTME